MTSILGTILLFITRIRILKHTEKQLKKTDDCLKKAEKNYIYFLKNQKKKHDYKLTQTSHTNE